MSRKLEGRMKEISAQSKRHPSGTSSYGDAQTSEFLEDISPVPSPDYDAPSPEADELELQLPDDTYIHSNAAGSTQSTSTPPSSTPPSQSIYTQQNMLGIGRNGTALTVGGDLSSRLDSMNSSRLKVSNCRRSYKISHPQIV